MIRQVAPPEENNNTRRRRASARVANNALRLRPSHQTLLGLSGSGEVNNNGSDGLLGGILGDQRLGGSNALFSGNASTAAAAAASSHAYNGSPTETATPARRSTRQLKARASDGKVGVIDVDSSAPVPASTRRSRRIAAAANTSSTTSSTSAVSSTKNSTKSTARRKRKPDDIAEADVKGGSAKKKSKVAGSDKNEEKTPDSVQKCTVCFEVPSEEELARIDGCGHLFCFSCIEKWAERQNTCPLCVKRFAKIERIVKPKRKKGEKRMKSSKNVNNRDQRADMVHPLQSLFEALRNRERGRNNGGVDSSEDHPFLRFMFENILNDSDDNDDPTPRVFHVRRSSTRSRSSTNNNPRSGTATIRFATINDSNEIPPGFVPFYHGSFHTSNSPGSVPRSFARNGNDSRAGSSSRNALEIADDDDEVIEIL